MGKSITQTVAALPEVLQPSVDLWFDRLREQADADDLAEDLRGRIAQVVACSDFAGIVLLHEWQWFISNNSSFADASVEHDAQELFDSISDRELDLAQQKSELRRFRNRTLLRILWREVHGLADLDETLQQLSALADCALFVATRLAEQQMEPRYGTPRSADRISIPLVILGMGKLGGRELNFSSDIDIIFCYPEDGETDGARCVRAEEYFTRLSRRIIALIDEVTADGFVFRVDTRLRPFGDSGPPAVSFSALETYLISHGRDWERYAYVKARVVGLQPPQKVLDDLHDNLIRPFVYRRYLDYGVFDSLREMHSMITAEVRRRELADNIKLGPGGIREAEFVVQAMQLVRGGSEPALQSRELQSVLPKLVTERALSKGAAEDLRLGYRFLRRLENFIQAIRDRQVHDLPQDDVDQARLALAMGYSDWSELLAALRQHRAAISNQFDKIAFSEKSNAEAQEDPFRRLLETNATEAQWTEVLKELTEKDAASIAGSIVRFANSPSTKQIDSIASDRLQRFVPTLLVLVLKAKRPLAALTRTLTVVEQVLRRSAYLALLNENPMALKRLVSLCERSQYISRRLARYPALLDELLDPGDFSGQVTKEDLEEVLRLRLAGSEADDSEDQMRLVAQFQRASTFRIAVADFNGSLPIMKVSDALTWLAEVVLEQTLRVASQDLARRHGVPQCTINGVTREAGFGIVGYGKLGGLEMSYGSDLDIVFLHDSTGDEQVTTATSRWTTSCFLRALFGGWCIF